MENKMVVGVGMMEEKGQVDEDVNGGGEDEDADAIRILGRAQKET